MEFHRIYLFFICQTPILEPAESLWIGSHKINWSPLPLFLKFTNPSLYQEKKHEAQARKFETKTPIIVARNSLNKFNSYDRNQYRRSYNPQHQHQYISHRGSRFPSGVGRFPEFPSRPQLPEPYLEDRRFSTNQQHQKQSGNDYANIVAGAVMKTSPTQTTTPAPIYVSTSATLLVSPPQAVAALSTPGPGISPIIDKLRKMTEWSKQSGFSKKEGKPTPVYPFHGRRLRVRKRLISGQALPQQSNSIKPKQYKHNIAEIIASNDNEDHMSTSTTNDRTNIIRPRKVDSNTSKNVGLENTTPKIDYVTKDDYEDAFRSSSPPNDIVIIHPTNAAFLIKDPMESQQTSMKKRKDKKLGYFKKAANADRPAPLTFRFGPEDAKVSPYRSY